ncbi:MAG: hypothetical protein AAB974_01810 [Patescibacteria group bacterium]
MKQSVSLQEWKKIGSEVKDVKKAFFELLPLLRSVLPKTKYSRKWGKMEKAILRVQSHLDDVVCRQFPSNREVVTFFYGKDKKDNIRTRHAVHD